jgi:hypothetical protein
VVISTAQLMLVLDELIVNTALPHIQRSLGLAIIRSVAWTVVNNRLRSAREHGATRGTPRTPRWPGAPAAIRPP